MYKKLKRSIPAGDKL